MHVMKGQMTASTPSFPFPPDFLSENVCKHESCGLLKGINSDAEDVHGINKIFQQKQ